MTSRKCTVFFFKNGVGWQAKVRDNTAGEWREGMVNTRASLTCTGQQKDAHQRRPRPIIVCGAVPAPICGTRHPSVGHALWFGIRATPQNEFALIN